MTKLIETITLMQSEDYKDRFKAEYYQLKIRTEKLEAFINRIKAAQIKNIAEPKHDCPLEVLESQLEIMKNYLAILGLRSAIEEVNLNGSK